MSSGPWLGLLIGILVLLALALPYAASLLYSVYKGAPYVPTPRDKAEAMLALAGVRQGMLVVDLGSGDGEICLAAARHGAKAIGIEANPWLVWLSRRRAWRAGQTPTFTRADLWTYALPRETDVVCVYLLPQMYGRLWQKLKAELRPGTKVVSHAFAFPDIEPVAEQGGIRLYRI